MQVLDTVNTVCLLAVAAGGAWFDLRERRVPNALTMSGLALALLLGALGGWGGLGAAAAGAGIAFLLALPVFLAGGLGGGDVKLVTAMGAFLGPHKLPIALLVIVLIGGIMSVVEVVRQKAVRRTLWNVWAIMRTLHWETFSRWKGREAGEPMTIDAPDAVTVPYAVAISSGAVLARFVL